MSPFDTQNVGVLISEISNTQGPVVTLPPSILSFCFLWSLGAQN